MKEEDFKDLEKRVESQLLITDNNLLELIQKTCIRKQSYQSILLKETKEMVDISNDIDILYAKLYNKYKFESDYNYSQKEIEYMISGDDEYCKLNVKLNKQKAIINFLDKTIDNFTSMSYQIKNLIEWKKFLAGQ